jgi:hypothetical protein
MRNQRNGLDAMASIKNLNLINLDNSYFTHEFSISLTC